MTYVMLYILVKGHVSSFCMFLDSTFKYESFSWKKKKKSEFFSPYLICNSKGHVWNLCAIFNCPNLNPNPLKKKKKKKNFKPKSLKIWQNINEINSEH